MNHSIGQNQNQKIQTIPAHQYERQNQTTHKPKKKRNRKCYLREPSPNLSAGLSKQALVDLILVGVIVGPDANVIVFGDLLVIAVGVPVRSRRRARGGTLSEQSLVDLGLVGVVMGSDFSVLAILQLLGLVALIVIGD